MKRNMSLHPRNGHLVVGVSNRVEVDCMTDCRCSWGNSTWTDTTEPEPHGGNNMDATDDEEEDLSFITERVSKTDCALPETEPFSGADGGLRVELRSYQKYLATCLHILRVMHATPHCASVD